MMELPNINNKNTKNTSVFGPLKFNTNNNSNNLFTSNDKKALSFLQTDNLFFKQKLAEFEVRLDKITAKGESSNKYDSSNNSKFNRFNSNRLREGKTDTKPLDDNHSKNYSSNNDDVCLSRKNSYSSQISARLNTGRSSLLTARTNESVSKIDVILDNLKKHRRSAVRKDVYESSNANFESGTVEKNLSSNPKPRPSTTGLPQVSTSRTDNDLANDYKIPSASTGEKISSRKSASKSSKMVKKSRAKTAKTDGEIKTKDDDYCHMFYSRSWRIHPELGIIKDKDRNEYDNTQTFFYHTKREPPETFIFSPDWI